jgi:hypothetical protein
MRRQSWEAILKIMECSVSVGETFHYYGDQIEEDETGGAYSTHDKNWKCTKTLVGKPE